MKRLKKVFALFLSMTMLLPGAGAMSIEDVPVAATTTYILAYPRESAQLSRYSAYIVALGDGMLEVEVDVLGTHKAMTKIGIQELHIEYETTPGVWRDWAVYKDRYTQNSLTHYETINFKGIVGRSYRVRVTVYAEDSKGSDTGNLISGSTIAT